MRWLAGMISDERPLRDGGNGATAYAEAVVVYLGFLVSKLRRQRLHALHLGRRSIVKSYGVGQICASGYCSRTFGRQDASDDLGLRRGQLF